MKTLHRLLDKLMSGRFIATVFIIGTYCLFIYKLVYLLEQKVISNDLFMGIFSGFASLATAIIVFYFTRTDRKTIENDEPENITIQKEIKPNETTPTKPS
jgi:hypothetical protein